MPIILPCLCRFCSGKCLTSFIDLICPLILNKNTKDYNCFCSAIYTCDQILNLALIFKKFKMKEFSEKSYNLFKEQSKNKCCKCGNIVKEKKYYISCVNDSQDPIWVTLIGNFAFLHLFCQNCYEVDIMKQDKNDAFHKVNLTTNDMKFFCLLCRNSHQIKERVDKANENSNVFCNIL